MINIFCRFPNWIFCYPLWRTIKWGETFNSVLSVNKAGEVGGGGEFSIGNPWWVSIKVGFQECVEDSTCTSWSFQVCSLVICECERLRATNLTVKHKSNIIYIPLLIFKIVSISSVNSYNLGNCFFQLPPLQRSYEINACLHVSVRIDF